MAHWIAQGLAQTMFSLTPAVDFVYVASKPGRSIADSMNNAFPGPSREIDVWTHQHQVEDETGTHRLKGLDIFLKIQKRRQRMAVGVCGSG